jgi:hypothetical protein
VKAALSRQRRLGVERRRGGVHDGGAMRSRGPRGAEFRGLASAIAGAVALD